MFSVVFADGATIQVEEFVLLYLTLYVVAPDTDVHAREADVEATAVTDNPEGIPHKLPPAAV